MRTVLLVTRHPDTARLGPALERAGFAPTTVQPERLAVDDSVAVRADVVILDLRDLPPSAFDLIASACVEEGALVMALAGEDQLDRLGSAASADDFALAPPNAGEVVKRIERAFWKKHGIDTENTVRCGALTIDLSNYRVTVGEEVLVLTFKEYELLRFLATNAGRVFTREQLLNRVWGYDYFGGARTVDVHIRRIRSKIEINGHAFIETVRNVGYRLVPDARLDEVRD